MRVLLAFALLLCSPALFAADAYSQLFQVAGWPQQRANFSDALSLAQQRYKGTLPPAVYDALINNSNQRFAPQGMEQRALGTLRQRLADPQPALRFFQSPLGGKVVSAEVQAGSRSQLAQHANGLPRMQASDTRRLLIGHLVTALPAKEAGAEVSLALAGVAADRLSQMLPGLLGGGQTAGLIAGQRERLMAQIGNDMDNTLLYVYRDLTDLELEEYATFAESAEGQAYYQAALAALRAALAVGQ
jgi:hypothetical protein